MSIHHQVLGEPGRDNAVAVTVDSGQRRVQLLFDCGDGCLDALSVSEIREFDHLCFSHFHMDHVAGFDQFFRCNYNRPGETPIHVWGPLETIEIMHHRFRGFWWNLHANQPGVWQVHEIDRETVRAAEFRTCEAFAPQHDLPETVGVAWSDPDFEIRSITLEHHGPTIGYRIDERPSLNISQEALAASGLRPGPWLEALKHTEAEEIDVWDECLKTGELRAQLLAETAGDAFAYLTDFELTDDSLPAIAEFIHGCDHVVCEAQYRDADSDLARKHCHATTRLVGQLAKAAEIGELTLFHLSERYRPEEWCEMLDEARAEFPATHFPDHWRGRLSD